MFKMQTWQMVVVALVAIACLGTMSVTLVRMFGRRAAAPATLREATAFESAAVGAVTPAGAVAYDAFSYRVPARLAGRTRIVVSDGLVSVAGPRVPGGLYEVWIWIQALLLALVPAALVAALVRLDWRWVVTALAIFVFGQVFSAIGAGVFPGLGEFDWMSAGRFKAVEFPVAAVSDVKIGPGWADGGIDTVLLPVKGGIDAMSEGHAVSFTAPDENGRSVRYALHLPKAADASALAAWLVE